MGELRQISTRPVRKMSIIKPSMKKQAKYHENIIMIL